MSRSLTLSTLVAAAVALGACATSPEGHMQLHLIPSKQMDSLGVQSFEQTKAETPISKDAATNRYIKCIADAIIPVLDRDNDPSQWEVVVLEDPQANAFALPGRKIGVYTGLLQYAVNQDQVAAVIGHEVGHVIAQHGNARISGQLAAEAGLALAAVALGQDNQKNALLMAGLGLGVQYGVILPFSRSHESEADVIGLDLMARAGFDPGESIPLWQNMAKAGASPPEFLSTHPSGSTRIKDLGARLPRARELEQQAHVAGRRPNCTR
jgi:predicted Zn-dependent protease